MIEVLIAVLVLAIGLLGMAALQTNGLQMTTGSLSRTQAVFLADDLIERARANRDNVANYAVAAGDPPDCDTGYAIANADVAAEDIQEWRNSISCLLPGGSSKVEVNGMFLTVTITWETRTDEEGEGSVQVEAEI